MTKRVIVSLLSVMGLALVCWWATEPNRREEILFQTPIRVVAGTTVTGSFEAIDGVPHKIALRFPGYGRLPTSEDPEDKSGAALAPLARAIGGAWWGGDAPPGFRASYVVRRGLDVVASGETGDRLSGFFGSTESGVTIAWIDHDLRGGQHEVAITFVEAVPELADFDARVTVGPAGDYISYAWLHAGLRWLFVGVIGLMAGLIVLVVSIMGRRRAHRPGRSRRRAPEA